MYLYCPTSLLCFALVGKIYQGLQGKGWLGWGTCQFLFGGLRNFPLYFIVFGSRMELKLWLIGIFAVTMASCYSLEGLWSLQSPPNSSPVSLQISNFVFKNQQILQKLVFKSCQEMRLQSSFSSKGIYINFKTQWILPIANLTCDSSSAFAMDKLSNKLRKVFNFVIRNDTLVFQDPLNETVVSFKRMTSDKKEDIEGIWNLMKFGNTTTSLRVTIGEGRISLCQGNTIMNYTLGRNKIQLKPVLSNCASISLALTLNKTRYYRKKEDILMFYDANVKPIMEMVYSQPYQPITDTMNKTVNVSGDISALNITGNWSILSLFGAKFPTTPYSIALNSSHLSLLGGCKNYSLTYSLNSLTQVISTGKANLTTPKTCLQSDDQFYISGLTKMVRYVIIKSDVSTSLRFYDDNGTAGYFLMLIKKDNSTTQATKGVNMMASSGKKAQQVGNNSKIVKILVSNTSSVSINSTKLIPQPSNTPKTTLAPPNINKPTPIPQPLVKPISQTPQKPQPPSSSASPSGKKL